MRSYREAPRHVKSTILELLVVDHNLTLKDLEEPLGVTRWQWNHAQAGIEAIRSGIKQKKTYIYGIAIDEIMNNNFNFQQNISKLKFSVYSDTFIKRTARASPFPCVIHQQ
jgi:hypothetical protein